MAGALPMGTFLGMVAAFFTAGTVGRATAGHEMSLSGGGMSLSAVICLSAGGMSLSAGDFSLSALTSFSAVNCAFLL